MTLDRERPAAPQGLPGLFKDADEGHLHLEVTAVMLRFCQLQNLTAVQLNL